VTVAAALSVHSSPSPCVLISRRSAITPTPDTFPQQISTISQQASELQQEELIMVTTHPVTDRILRAVKRAHRCDLDALATSLPELTWNQVFFEIDRLSRNGEVVVTFDGGDRYMIQLPEHKKKVSTHHARS